MKRKRPKAFRWRDDRYSSQESVKMTLIPQLRDLSLHGRGKVEKRLREVYATGDEAGRSDAAKFLTLWHDRRAWRLADEWMRDGPGVRAFHSILELYWWRGGIRGFRRFRALLNRKDLSDEYVDWALDQFSSLMWSDTPFYHEGLELMSRFLDHPCGEIRWTAVFSLGKLCVEQYRHRIERLTLDETLTGYGYVSRVAKNILLAMDGDPEVDIWQRDPP